MEPNAIIELLQNVGVLGLLVFILVGGSKGWWVYGAIHEDVKRDRDDWKHMALEGTNLAEKAVTQATHATTRRRTRSQEE